MASFGETLRRERELRGIGLHDIAEATKISVRFLQALEQDRVDVLPGGIFRRAFVRQYARHLGLDPERLVAEFVYAHGDEPADKAPQAPPSAPRRIPWRLVLALGLLGAGVLLSTLRLGSTRPAREAAAPLPAPVPVAARPADRVYPPPASQPERSDNLVLILSARQRCWVAAEVDGQPVLNRELGEGETQTLEATGRIVLSVGNAGGLSFRVNDRRGVPLGRAGEVRRNIVITRESLPSLVEDTVPIRASHSS